MKKQETKDTVVLKCIKELVEHNTEMVNWCIERDEDSTLHNYYEGKVDAYTRVVELLTDIEAITS